MQLAQSNAEVTSNQNFSIQEEQSKSSHYIAVIFGLIVFSLITLEVLASSSEQNEKKVIWLSNSYYVSE